ncbi:MAG TPA: hypothetical protein PLM24_06890 [Methanothrix sp.]|nr:hypothetical protein [Methanothrix sp.]HPJ83526.1 hypothetical protein [Methanothrix sp.]HPR66847.1 hypothetical protein [Methanothrix sp.]
MFKHSWILALILVFVAAFACGCVSEDEGAEEGAETEVSHEEGAVSAEEHGAASDAMEEVEEMEAESEEMADHGEDEGKDMAEAAVGEVESEVKH